MSLVFWISLVALDGLFVVCVSWVVALVCVSVLVVFCSLVGLVGC